MRRLVIGQLAITLSAWAGITAPNSLSVVSATNKKVQFAWKAGGSDTNQYVLERRTLEGSTFAAIGAVVPDVNKVLATATTDAAFDPFTAYVYRVRGVNTTANPADVSDATNEVTVGPPPYGYTRVIATPDGLPYPSNRGHHPQMVLDGSGDPMLTYLIGDPNDDNSYSDNEIWFVRWDRAHYTWTTPVRVALPGDQDSNVNFSFSFRLACDVSNGSLAILFTDATIPDQTRLSIADSTDGGVTWRQRTVTSDPSTAYNFPSIALGGGKVYFSYYHDFDGIRYQSGKLSDDPMLWSSELVPTLGGLYYGYSSDVGLDSEGKPGVAYLVLDENGHKEIFYRPGGQAYTANYSVDGPADFWQIRLVFSGTNPRIAFAGMLDNLYFEDYDHALFVLSSTDGGATWNPRANVISDGNSDMAGPIDLSFDSQGRGAIASQVSGGNSGGVQCGEPKLSLSEDMAKWKTCGITATYVTKAYSPSVKFAFNDTLYYAFQVTDYPFDATSPIELAAGVYFWRGPIGFQFPVRPPE